MLLYRMGSFLRVAFTGFSVSTVQCRLGSSTVITDLSKVMGAAATQVAAAALITARMDICIFRTAGFYVVIGIGSRMWR